MSTVNKYQEKNSLNLTNVKLQRFELLRRDYRYIKRTAIWMFAMARGCLYLSNFFGKILRPQNKGNRYMLKSAPNSRPYISITDWLIGSNFTTIYSILCIELLLKLDLSVNLLLRYMFLVHILTCIYCPDWEVVSIRQQFLTS